MLLKEKPGLASLGGGKRRQAMMATNNAGTNQVPSNAVVDRSNIVIVTRDGSIVVTR